MRGKLVVVLLGTFLVCGGWHTPAFSATNAVAESDRNPEPPSESSRPVDALSTNDGLAFYEALDHLMGDWPLVVRYYEDLLNLVERDSSTVRGRSLSSPGTLVAPGVAPEVRKSHVILTELAEAIYDAPLGKGRAGLTARYLTYLESLMDNPKTGVPRYWAPKLMFTTVCPRAEIGFNIIPGPAIERVRKRMAEAVFDAQIGVRAEALLVADQLCGLGYWGNHQDANRFLRERCEAEKNVLKDWEDSDTEDRLMHSAIHFISQLDYQYAGMWRGAQISEEEYRTLLSARTEDLYTVYLSGKDPHAEIAFRTMTSAEARRRESFPYMVSLAGDPSRLADIVKGFLLRTSTAAPHEDRQRVDKVFAVIEEHIEGNSLPPWPSGDSVIKRIDSYLDERLFREECSASACGDVAPILYGRERALALLVSCVEHGPLEIRRLAASLLRSKVSENAEAAETMLESLEKCYLRVTEEFGIDGQEPPQPDTIVPEESEMHWDIEKSLRIAIQAIKDYAALRDSRDSVGAGVE